MKLYVEVPFSLLLFAFSFSDPVTINLIIYRSCYVVFGYNETECALLGTHHHDNETAKLEQEVQPYANILATTKSLIETFVTAIWCFFLGPWSDKYGRRPVLLFVLTGYTLGYLIITFVSFIPNASPVFLLLSTIPICLFGGFPALLAVTICYITDTTSLLNRGVRMGIFEAIISAAGLLGNVSSSFVFNACGYLVVYVITTSCIFLSWLSVLVGVPESLLNPETEGKIRNLFKCSLVKDTVMVTIKKRNGRDRALLWTIIALTVIFLLAVTADGRIVILYLRRKFHWSLQQYTLFSSGRKVAWLCGSILGGYVLHRLLYVEETIIILIGFLCTFTNVLLQGLASKDWHMYIAGASICFGGSISPMARSLISKLVPLDEIGKVFSFIIITETLVDLIGSPIYAHIYNQTIKTVPGMFNFVTTGIYGFEILLTIPAIILQFNRHRIGYQTINGDDVSE